MRQLIRTELKSVRRRDVCTEVAQKIIEGPKSILDLQATLVLTSPKDAVALAVEILKTVPPSCLRGEALAGIVTKFTENTIEDLKVQQVNIPHTLDQ